MEQLTSLDKFKSYLAGLGGDRVKKDDYLFVCTGPPLSRHRVEIPRERQDLISEHRQNCIKCLQIEKELDEQRAKKYDMQQRKQYCQMRIFDARIEVAAYQDRLKAIEEKKARGETPDPLEMEKLRVASYDNAVALETIKRETEELQRLKEKEKEKEKE